MMRSISKKDTGEKLVNLLNEKDPVDEDIQILDENGLVVAAVITSKAYKFFLEKIEKEENKIDINTVLNKLFLFKNI